MKNGINMSQRKLSKTILGRYYGMLQYKLAMSFRQEDLIRPKMSAKLETLHAPLIAELKRGRKIR